MVDDGLVRYVRERLGEGYSEEQVRAALGQHGHSQESVDEAFRSVHRSRSTALPLLTLIALLVLGAVLAVLFWPREAPPPVQPPVQPPSSGTATRVAELKAGLAGRTEEEAYYAVVEAASLEARSVSDGILYCTLAAQRYQAYCLQELAEQGREPGYCAVIGDAESRDDCYLSLVLAGEDQYCSQLLLRESKRVCAVLREG